MSLPGFRIEQILFILLVMIKLFSLLQMTKHGLNFGLAKRGVTLLYIF